MYTHTNTKIERLLKNSKPHADFRFVAYFAPLALQAQKIKKNSELVLLVYKRDCVATSKIFSYRTSL